MICTITLLRSLEDPGGGFDVPNSKCLPDGGSSDCVTGSPSLNFASAYDQAFYPSSINPKDPRCNLRENLVYPPSPPSSAEDVVLFPPSPMEPQPIRGVPRVDNFSRGPATPPLTPDDFVEDVSVKSDDDALELLTTLFPNHAMTAFPFARCVSISSPGMGTSFDGVVLELPGEPKTFYVDGRSAEVVYVRESIVALLDLADEHLQCSALVIALEKDSPALSGLLHALMYVGGTVVTKPAFPVHPAYILFGLEI